MSRNIGFIIVNYNGWGDTVAAAESLQKHVSVPHLIVVVDNGSASDDLKQLRQHLPASVHIIEQAENRGFAGGNNPGIAWCLEQGVEYICLFNNDAVAIEPFAEQLIATLESHPDIGLVNPLIVNADNHSTISFAGGKVAWANFDITSHLHLNQPVGNIAVHTTIASDFATGACVMMRSSDLRKLGKLDERYFMYYEDTEYSMRFQRAGLNCAVATRVKVAHGNSVSVKKLPSSFYVYHMNKNRLLLLGQYAPVYWKLWYWLRACVSLVLCRVRQRFGIQPKINAAVADAINDLRRKRYGNSYIV